MPKSINAPSDPHDFIAAIERNWLPNTEMGWDNFSSRGYSTTNAIENDAIRHLAEDHPHLPRWANGVDEASFEAWRAAWVSAALQMRREHLDPASSKFAAAEVLVLGSSLRAAIASGEAERAAALGALIVCYALVGGYSKMEPIRRARAEAYDNGVGRDAEDMKKARKACVKWAADIWRKDPAMLIGKVATELLASLQQHKAKLPNLESFPKAGTVRTWLREAAKAGTLTIPAAAQRQGRPPKSSK